jgi:hypothetical protein
MKPSPRSRAETTGRFRLKQPMIASPVHYRCVHQRDQPSKKGDHTSAQTAIEARSKPSHILHCPGHPSISSTDPVKIHNRPTPVAQRLSTIDPYMSCGGVTSAARVRVHARHIRSYPFWSIMSEAIQLYDTEGRRLYLTSAERDSFLDAATQADRPARTCAPCCTIRVAGSRRPSR